MGCGLVSLPLFRASLKSPGFERQSFTDDEITVCARKHLRVSFDHGDRDALPTALRSP